MQLTNDQKFEILKLEMELTQKNLDKYDEFVYRNRNWFISLWLGSVGLAFSIKSPVLPLLGIGLAFVYWMLEGIIRFKSWYKNVSRFRYLRKKINEEGFDLDSIRLYDLTNSNSEKNEKLWPKIKTCFFRMESIFLYLVMIVASFIVSFLLSR